jgi:hypothetical protein
MTDDERVMASVARGYWYELVLAGYFKRVLTSQELSVAERLELLEGLGTFVHGALTPAALAAVAPAGETFMEIVETALKLDLDANSETGEASFAVLTRPDVFANLLKLEPSLSTALQLMSRGSLTDGQPLGE